jgi:hypothetical protein
VVATDAGLAPPRVSLEVRDDGGLVLGGAAQDTGALGWTGGAGVFELTFRMAALPLADGRFHLRVNLVDAQGDRLLHTLEDAIRFFVIPSGAETGLVLLDGEWTLQETAPRAPSVPA